MKQPSNQHTIRKLILAKTNAITLAFVFLFSTSTAMADGLVIRGGTCSAAAFKNGASSSQSVRGDYYLSGLSVNCTTDTNNKANHIHYHNGIGMFANYCVATIKSIEMLNVKISRDPQAGNPYHCLVSGNAKNIAKKLTRY